MNLYQDSRIVMTLDAGGTNFRFSATRAGTPTSTSASTTCAPASPG
jgi:hexokinase